MERKETFMGYKALNKQHGGNGGWYIADCQARHSEENEKRKIRRLSWAKEHRNGQPYTKKYITSSCSIAAASKWKYLVYTGS